MQLLVEMLYYWYMAQKMENLKPHLVILSLVIKLFSAHAQIAYPCLMKSAQCLLTRLLKRSSSIVNLLPPSFNISVGPNRYRNSVPWAEPKYKNTLRHVICGRGSKPLRTKSCARFLGSTVAGSTYELVTSRMLK